MFIFSLPYEGSEQTALTLSSDDEGIELSVTDEHGSATTRFTSVIEASTFAGMVRAAIEAYHCVSGQMGFPDDELSEED